MTRTWNHVDKCYVSGCVYACVCKGEREAAYEIEREIAVS